MVKKGISFRWEDKTIRQLNSGAERSNLSKTAFAENAVEIYDFLMTKPIFKKLDPDQIKEKINHMLTNSQTLTSTNGPTPKPSKRRPGFVINLIFEYIKSKEGDRLTTNEIARELNVPKSTVRSYLRKLMDRYPEELELFEGRPNQIRYTI